MGKGDNRRTFKMKRRLAQVKKKNREAAKRTTKPSTPVNV